MGTAFCFSLAGMSSWIRMVPSPPNFMALWICGRLARKVMLPMLQLLPWLPRSSRNIP